MTRPNALPWLPPAPPIPVGTYIPVHIPLDVCSTELVLVRKEVMGNEYKANKLDGRKRVGRTDEHTNIQKKVAPPAPPNPVLGFTTLGQTDRNLILVGLV